MNTIVNTILSFMWFLLDLLLRPLYGFRIEGAENIPSKGPFIALMKEGGGPISMIFVAIGLIQTQGNLMRTLGDKYVATMHEDVWRRIWSRYPMELPIHPLRSHSAGVLALGLMDQLQALREGGVAAINPEGDLSWDGRPLPIRPGAAWLGLHTAAPLVPMVGSAGGYDIWPLWQKRPSLRGRVVVRIGRPFQLCDSPMERVTPPDLERANARIWTEINQLYYGPGGVAEWAGPPLRDGVPLKQPIQLQPVPAQPPPEAGEVQVAERRWGIPLLLWRCPVCHTNDALIHNCPRFRPQTLDCQACGTRWTIHRVPGQDFRLKVVNGPAGLVGLDMALSTWHDEIKAGFQPSPMSARDVKLLDGEELYLKADGVELLPYKPSTLFDGWTSGEAPRAQPGGQAPSPEWASIGRGRLFLTKQRLLWDGAKGRLDFWWPVIRSVFLPWQSTLGIIYGSALYRFALGPEAALKWVTYAGTMTQQAAECDGHTVTVSRF
jgi:1-acyl-sn-glycerol-3-phosphate acyltransferase